MEQLKNNESMAESDDSAIESHEVSYAMGNVEYKTGEYNIEPTGSSVKNQQQEDDMVDVEIEPKHKDMPAEEVSTLKNKLAEAVNVLERYNDPERKGNCCLVNFRIIIVSLLGMLSLIAGIVLIVVEPSDRATNLGYTLTGNFVGLLTAMLVAPTRTKPYVSHGK